MNGDDRARWEKTFEALGHIKSDIHTLFKTTDDIKEDIKTCKLALEKTRECTHNNKLEIVKITTQIATIIAVATIAIQIFL